jgi:hypothetical protein
VSVDAENNTSEVHVFDGEVNIRDADLGPVKLALTEGQAAVVDATGTPKPRLVEYKRFLSPQAVAYKRWQSWSRRARQDPTLISYFDFEPVAAEPHTLHNVADSGVGTNGAILNAPWATGRWRDKKALWFDNDDHSVEFTVPGEYTQLTIAAWVKIDRFDSGSSLILRPVNKDPQGHVRFITSRRSSLVNGSVIGLTESKPQTVTQGVPTGRWVNLAVTFDTDMGVCSSYLDGELMMTRRIPTGITLKIGAVELMAGENHQPELNWQALRGKVDEFLIWNRVLVDYELKSIVRESALSGSM